MIRPPSPPPGVGASAKVTELPETGNDNEMNRTSAYIEPVAGGRSYGVWLVSLGLGAPQSFTHEGRTYVMGIRPSACTCPTPSTLKKFSHDLYAGTDIPRTSPAWSTSPIRGRGTTGTCSSS